MAPFRHRKPSWRHWIRLFSTLIRERISHGDLKGHNLFLAGP